MHLNMDVESQQAARILTVSTCFYCTVYLVLFCRSLLGLQHLYWATLTPGAVVMSGGPLWLCLGRVDAIWCALRMTCDLATVVVVIDRPLFLLQPHGAA